MEQMHHLKIMALCGLTEIYQKITTLNNSVVIWEQITMFDNFNLIDDTVTINFDYTKKFQFFTNLGGLTSIGNPGEIQQTLI